MATNTTAITITHTDDQVPGVAVFQNNRDRALASLAAWVESFAAGQVRGSMTMTRNDGGATTATGNVLFAGASGNVITTINGVGFTVAAGATDTATAAAMCDAIEASTDPMVKGMVTVSHVGGVMTITSVRKGSTGNAITLGASGTGALASGNRLTGGADATAAATFTLER